MATSRTALPAFLTQSRADLHNKFVDLEWQQRERLAQGINQPANSSQPSQWARLSGDAVAARNRYLNVEPYAQNRIRLDVAEHVNDYINASPIRLGNRRYIATQGPKDTSVNHFYRMIASELKSPAVIVMLTQTHEAGREKCFQYYPLSEEESPLSIPVDQAFGDDFQGEVHLMGVEDHAKSRSQIRTMILRTSSKETDNKETEFTHLLFSGWPDFLVPEGDDRAALIELVRLSAILNRPTSSATTIDANGNSFGADLASADQDNPRIVHCSAGVGRSGTFIALDYLLSLLHSGQLDTVSGDQDPIADTVDILRQQRMMMVQGESQFFFLYEALREQFMARQQEQHTTAGADQNSSGQGLPQR